MALEKKLQSFEPIPEGKTQGIIIAVLDMGIHMRKKFKSEVKEPKERILITIELPKHTFMAEDGSIRRRVISKEMNFSLDDRSELGKILRDLLGKNLRKHANENGAIDPRKLLGKKVCVNLVQVERNENIYTNIDTITSSETPELIPDPENSLMALDFSDPSEDVLKKIPAFIRKKLTLSLHYKGSKMQELVERVESAEAPEDDTHPSETDI